MTKPQQQLVILGAVVVVMIAVYGRAFRRPPAPPPAPDIAHHASSAPAGGHAPTGASAFAEGPRATQRAAQREHAAQLTWGRDPFGRAGSVDGLSLSGILWDADEPVAMINGEMLQQGDELEGYRVVTIGQDRVVLSDGSEVFELLIAP